VLLAYYKSAELDVSIRPAGIGAAPIGARVSLLGLEHYVAGGGTDGAPLTIPDVDGLQVLTFTAYYSRSVLDVSIHRPRMPAFRARTCVSLEGLPEFFRWCTCASKIYCQGGKLDGFGIEALAALCGVRPTSTGVQDGAFDEFELAGGVDLLGGDATADADADALQRRVVQ
jgi:hypothetical protein